MKKTHEEYLQRAIQVSRDAVAHGNMPFAAILVDGEGNVVMEQENISMTEPNCINHAETKLASRASEVYDAKFLWDCTLYTTAEPCCMCTGACYWANIGTIVYALPETTLLKLTGANELNPTLDLPCREVISRGQKDIKIFGPFEALEDEAAKVHEGFWD